MDSRSRPNATIAGLVSGILSDLRDLFSAELRLAWVEFKEELRKAKVSAAAFLFGLGLILLGTLFFMQMLVQFLYGYAGLPLWGAYGVVGLSGMGIGAVLLVKSRR